MEIKLLTLEMENFKKIQKFTLNLDGKNVRIDGRNATGKTTVVDAFQWLLFDKNSDGNTKFSVKPLNADGSEKHHLETSVKAVLSVNGNPVKLKKTLKEKWVKKRGEENQEFSGHITEYEIDDVPKSAGDFKAFIKSVLEEDIFRMITNIHYFNSLKNDEKRSIIMRLATNVTVEDVMEKYPDLESIKSFLEKKSPEDLETQWKKEKTAYNNNLKSIPERIDENKKIDFSMLEGLTQKAIQQEIEVVKAQLQDIQAKKANLSANGEIVNLEMEIRKMEVEKAQLSVFKSPKQDKLEKIKVEEMAIFQEKSNFEIKINSLENEIKNIKSTIDVKMKRKSELYIQYDEEFAKVFTAHACAYCGQPLPKEKIDDLEGKFNLQKTENLNRIVNEGKKVAAEIQDLEKLVVGKEEQVKALKQDLVALSAKYQNLLVEREAVNNELDINPNQDKIEDIVSKIRQTQERISLLKQGAVINPYEQEEIALNAKLTDLNIKNSKFALKAEVDQRVAVLTAELEDTKKKAAAVERQLILLEQFNYRKAEMLEQSINSQFDIVKFKLFEIQINGGINQVCVATVNGVPYPDLNNAMKINAGLDIIRSLQKIYGVKAPIFIDNAESVNKIIDLPDTQLIKLYVTEDPQLNMYLE